MEQKVRPDSAVLIGGPVSQLRPYVSRALGLPCRLPPHAEVANAAGAALARVTAEVTLQADTTRKTVVIPEADIQQSIDDRFDLDEAVLLAEGVLRGQAAGIGAAPDELEVTLTEKQVFNMIREYSRAGRNIRLKMCVTPGLVARWKRKAR
jgi:hypothetical protein